jgi:hypothetical protein
MNARSATAEPPTSSPGREVRLRSSSPSTRRAKSPTAIDSPALAAAVARQKKERAKRKKEDERLATLYMQRENGFRYNAYATPTVFSTFGADTLVLKDRERKELEIAVARRRAQIEHDRKAREVARADELRRKRVEHQRIQHEHDLKVAHEEQEILRKAEEAAAARKQKALASSLSQRRRAEISAAKDLSRKRESVRAARRHPGHGAGEEAAPDDAEVLESEREAMAVRVVSQVFLDDERAAFARRLVSQVLAAF